MSICMNCRHRQWVLETPRGGNWTVCICRERDFRFGLESDVARGHGDKKREIDAMLDRCVRFEKRQTEN
jgi:hypothetical protein